MRLTPNSVKLDGNVCGEGAKNWKEEVAVGFNGTFLTRLMESASTGKDS